MLQPLGNMHQESKKVGQLFGRKVRIYTKEFRAEVVQYSDGHTIKDTVARFNIPAGTVGTWRAKQRKDKLKATPPKSNRPDSKPNGPRADTTPMPDNKLTDSTTENLYNVATTSADMTVAEKELVQLAERLWKELTAVDEVIKLIRIHKI